MSFSNKDAQSRKSQIMTTVQHKEINGDILPNAAGDETIDIDVNSFLSYKSDVHKNLKQKYITDVKNRCECDLCHHNKCSNTRSNANKKSTFIMKHKGNLTASSTTGVKNTKSGIQHLRNNDSHKNKIPCTADSVRSEAISKQTIQTNNTNTFVESPIAAEISRMFHVTNSYQAEIESINVQYKGDENEKLLRRQQVFIKWIHELSETNLYLLHLLDSQNIMYERQIEKYNEKINHLTSEAETCSEDSSNYLFQAEGLTNENKYTRKLIETLQENVTHRKKEINTLQALKETCDRKKTSLLQTLINLRDGKNVALGKELSLLFNSKFITSDEENIMQKEFQHLLKEKEEMEIILDNKNKEIHRLKQSILDQEKRTKSTKSQSQGAQTIVSFDSRIQLTGHEDLFLLPFANPS